jgi:hypothetical protein
MNPNPGGPKTCGSGSAMEMLIFNFQSGKMADGLRAKITCTWFCWFFKIR